MRKLLLALSILTTGLVNAQWVVQPAPSDNFNSVSFSSTTNGLVSGEHGLYYTSNGGTTWTNVIPSGPSGDSLVFMHTSFTSISYTNSYWLVIGKDTISDMAVIFRVNNTATSCVLVYTGSTASQLNDIAGYTPYAFAVGNNNLILYSGNSGQTWSSYYTPPGVENYRGITLNTISSICMLGDSGHAYHKTQSGSWIPYSVSANVTYLKYNINNNLYGLGDTIFTALTYPSLWSANHNFIGGVMNASSISSTPAGTRYISTDHGVYVSGGNNWELQGSSSGYILNGISTPSNTIGYAVGENGIILKTTNGGRPNVPYPDFTLPNGGCTGAPIVFTNHNSTLYQFTWKVNNQFISNAYSPSFSFILPGTYSVTLIATDGPYTDSLTQTLVITDMPDLNKVVTVSDTICHSGSALITINNSDIGVVYLLYKIYYPNTPIDSVNGNGAGATLNTGTITNSTNYVVKARYQNVDCSGLFPDTVHVHVDHTTAAFHVSLYNVFPGEPVDYYQDCIDANHYRWYFGNNATPSFDSTAAPSGIVYQNIGPNTVGFATWNDNGCYDSIAVPGAYCFNDTSAALNTPNCWAFKYDGINISGAHLGMALRKNTHMILGGVMYGGTTVFTTRTGRNWVHNVVSEGGIYLVDYTQKGVLRWTIHSQSENTSASEGDLGGIKVQPNGDIVATGIHRAGWFYFNDLDSVHFDGGYFILCIDSMGKYKWMDRIDRPISNDNYARMFLTTDSVGNIYVSGSDIPLQFTSSIYGNQAIPTVPTNTSPFFASLAPDGRLKWMTYISQPVVYPNNDYTRVAGIAVSAAGQLYFTGTTTNSPLTVHSTSGPDIIIPVLTNKNLVLGCYDTSGVAQWVHSINTDAYYNMWGSSQYVANACLGLSADSHGNVYLSGYMSANPIVFPSVSAASYSYPTTDYYTICSYNRMGNLRWVTGSNTSQPTVGVGTLTMVQGRNEHIYLANKMVSNNTGVIQFLSTDGTYTPINMNSPSVYLTEYDTMGVVQSVSTEMGLTSTNVQQGILMLLAVNDSGIIYGSGNVALYSSLQQTNIANSVMNFFSLGSYVAKFSPACAPVNVFYPQTTSAVAGNDSVFSISAFPNPVNDALNISFENEEAGMVSVELYDLNGQRAASLGTVEVGQGRSLKSFAIGQYDLANGAYVLSCTTEHSVVRMMLVVAR